MHVHSLKRKSPTEGLLYMTKRNDENKEMAQIQAHCQKEIESIKGEVARLKNLLEQALSFKSRNGKFAQLLMEAPIAHVPYVPQNLGVDSATKQHFIPISLIQPAQTLVTVDLTAKGTSND